VSILKNLKKLAGSWTGEPTPENEVGSITRDQWINEKLKKNTVAGTTLEKRKLTEGTKFDQGKPAFGLLAPELLFGVSEILEYGANKYAARNWEIGISYTRVFGGLMRHLWAWWAGESLDPETGKSHLWHAGCNLMFLIAFEARGLNEFDDRK